MKNALTTLAVSLALAACSSATTTLGFPAADVNDDDAVSREEYLEFWNTTTAFAVYDVSGDGNLDRAEYGDAVDDAYDGDDFFIGLDRDMNHVLSQNEFVGGWYLMFDVDRNGVLSRDEYNAAINALDGY